MGAPQPFTTRKRPKNGQGLGLTSKWTRVGGPPNPDLQMDKGGAQPFTTPPPTLHDLQMDKGWGPPTLHDLQMDKRKRPKNGQGLGLTSKWTRVGGLPNPDLQMDKGGAQPFTTPPPTLHDLQMDKGWGPPNPSRLANGQRLDKGWGPPEFITSTAVGQGLDPLNLSRFGSGSPNKLYRFNIRFQADQASCPKIDKSMTGPFGPERTPTQTFKLCLDKHWGLQTIERLSIFLRGPGASPQIETSMTSPSSQNVRYCRASFKFCLNRDSRPKVEKSMTGPFGPERTPTQTSNFDWTSIGASKPSNA